MQSQIASMLFIAFSLFISLLHSHGFSENTFVRTHTTRGDCFVSISGVCHNLNYSFVAKSYDTETTSYVLKPIVSVGKSTASCSIKLFFSSSPRDCITCSPTQEFYILATGKWQPAYKLRTHDELFTENGLSIPIVSIEFIEEPITVYSIEVRDTHNFFVSNRAILTHNIILPALTVGFSIPFGMGTVGGGISGCFFGPITTTCCFAAGAFIGWFSKKLWLADQIPNYKCTLNPHHLGMLFNNSNNAENKQPLPPANPPPSRDPDPGEDPDKNNKKPKINISENDASHIFRKKRGHMLDTPANRLLLIEITSDTKNFLGSDQNYTQWYGKINSMGQQVWTGVRDGIIRYGGINEIPKTYNPITGLSRLSPIKYGK